MRFCMDCGCAIEACFGFVLAGDFYEALVGKRRPDRVRERCGLCAELRHQLWQRYLPTKQ